LSDYLLSVILGIVEGLTEFLPVSSTAHLRIAEKLLQPFVSGLSLESGYWKMYSIVIQLGAILVLPIYFRSHIDKLFSTFPDGEKGDCDYLTHPLSLVLIASVVTAGPSYLLTKMIGKNLENFYIIGSALLIGGIVMWIIDAVKSPWEKAGPDAPGSPIHTWKMDDIHGGQAIWIGACQILSAAFPGSSRSMCTIAAGQLAGMSRAAALEFSFFLSIPTMAMATLYTLFKSIHGGKDENPIGVAQISSHQWVILAIGFIVSFIVAYGAVAWFMAWVRKRGFAVFAMYRIVVGLAVLAWAMGMIGL
jgi:undecaprenyl-diphosphatase